MAVSSETLQLLQLFVVLGIGRAASAQEMRQIETSVAADGGLTAIYAEINAFMEDQVAQKGYAEVIRAIAKNGAGLQLSDAELTQITGELAVVQGTGTWSELFVDLAADNGTFGAEVVGRAKIAVHFTETLDTAGESGLSVDFGTGATVSGSSTYIKAAYSSLAQKKSTPSTVGAISSLGNEALVVTDSGLVAAAALNELDTQTTGVVTISSATDVTGTTTELTAAYAGNTAGTIRGLEDKALIVTDSGSVAATALNGLDAQTTGVVTVSSATDVSGTTTDLTAAYAGNSAGTIRGLEDKALNVTDTGSVAATALNGLDALTTGVVASTSITGLSGTAAEITEAYAGNAAGTIKGLENQSLIVTDRGSVSADALNALGALTTGGVAVSPASAPTLVITGDTANIFGVGVTYTFTFSEAVSGFEVGEVAVVGGTKATTFATGADNSSVYTLVVTPDANSTTNMTVDVAAVVTTADGAANTVVNTKAPTLEITDDEGSTANNASGAVTYTFTFSEAVSGFTAGEVTLVGGTKADDFASGVSGSSVYTLVATPDNDPTTNMTVGVAADVAVANGVVSTIFKTNAPTPVVPRVVISDNTAVTNDGDPVTYTFTFNEAVDDFTVKDVVLTGGTSTGAFASGVSGDKVYTLVVTPDNDPTTNMTVDVRAGFAESGGPNTNAVVPVVPTVVISDNTADTPAGEPVTYTFTFNEAVDDFTVKDVVLTGGTSTGSFASGVSGDKVYTLVVTPDNDPTTNMTVDVRAGFAESGGPNTNAVVPRVVISDNTADTPAGEPVTYTFTFNEAVDDFTVKDVVLTGGTSTGSFASGVSGDKVYTLVVTPDNDPTTNMTVDVRAGFATSDGGPNTNASTDDVASGVPTDTFSASAVTTTGTISTTFTDNFTGTIGVYTDSGGESLYNGVAAVAITNTTSGSVSVGPGLPTTVYVVIKNTSNAIVGDVRPVILGPNAVSTVNGTGASEIIFGFEGVSTINAGGGDNIIIGGAGIDTITTGNGNNIIQSGAGADFITTGSGNDIFTGGAGIKTINSGAGNDNIYGGAGADVLSGGAGNDNISGSDGADILTGGDGNDIISGGIGADVLTGGEGVDNLTGGIGADVFAWVSADIDTTAGAVIDTINDYGTNADSISGSWGASSASNYFNNPTAAADLAALLLAADTILDGTIKYYVGQVGADSYLVTDSDGIGYTDVIKLVGFTATFAIS